ncbi:hypothetical protein [Ottowia sp.]|uniref:hypothetical protein n=1 Tax=Ottowia sp. TaxID=1898956 RepID=UPI003A88C009
MAAHHLARAALATTGADLGCLDHLAHTTSVAASRFSAGNNFDCRTVVDQPTRRATAPRSSRVTKIPAPSSEAMRRNGYFTLLGLGAPADQDAFETGKHFFEMQLKEYEQLQRTGHSEPYAREAFPRSSIDITPARCPEGELDCYEHYIQHTYAIRHLLTANTPLAKRYLSLLETPEFHEIIIPELNVSSPDIAYVAVSELIIMQVALMLNSARQVDGVALLMRNAQILQRLAAGSRSWVNSMNTRKLLFRQQQFISNALRHQPLLMAYSANLLQILDIHPTDLGTAIESEAAMSFGMLSSLAAAGSRTTSNTDSDHLSYPLRSGPTQFVYLPNATMNAGYPYWQGNVALARIPATELNTQINAIRTKVPTRAIGNWLPPWLRLRNPLGAYLLSLNTDMASYATYIERTHDVEAHRRLVLLQIKALQENIDSAHMTTWLASQPPELRNPYTLEPMRWDATAQALVFEGRQDNSQKPEPRNVYRVPLRVSVGAIADPEN